jgi:hypothetical protein
LAYSVLSKVFPRSRGLERVAKLSRFSISGAAAVKKGAWAAAATCDTFSSNSTSWPDRLNS